MIDTVVIRVSLSSLLPNKNSQQELGYIETWNKRTNGKFTIWHRNPSATEIALYGYVPTLTAFKHSTHVWRLFVDIQFSIPKLLLGNNLDEVTDNQILPTLRALRSSLEKIGFNPDLVSLLNAEVISLHYSKNILLEQGYTAREVIRNISRIQTGGRLRKRDSQYTRGGIGTVIHNKSFGFSIYDKVAEVKQTDNAKLKSLDTLPEVMRLEVRLENKRKIKHMFKKLELNETPSFREIFNSTLSQRFLIYYWKELIAPQSAIVTDTNESAGDIVHRIIRGVPDIKIHTALKYTALVLFSRSSGGLGELRSLVMQSKYPSAWYRLYAEVKKINHVLENQEDTWWEQVTTQLEEYIPIKIIKK